MADARREYFIFWDGAFIGPLPPEHVRQMIQGGGLDESTPVRIGNKPDSIALGAVAEFRRFFAGRSRSYIKTAPETPRSKLVSG
jgi:hypothetical protein